MVKLTRSFAFDETFAQPEEGALVWIMDEDDGLFEFTEDQPGVYKVILYSRGKSGPPTNCW